MWRGKWPMGYKHLSTIFSTCCLASFRCFWRRISLHDQDYWWWYVVIPILTLTIGFLVMMLHFIFIQKCALWGLFNPRNLLIFISLLKPLWFFSFFISSYFFLRFLLKSQDLPCRHAIAFYILKVWFPSPSFWIYAVMCSGLGFRIIPLVVGRNRLHIVVCHSDGSHH